jgi:hypothetical protein
MKTGSLIILILLSQLRLIAQKNDNTRFDLKAIKRIELVEDHPGVYREYKVERDKANKWVSVRIYSDDDVTASGEIPTNKFIRDIPES